MDILRLLLFCVVPGTVLTRKETTYSHTFVGDGGKIEPEIDLVSRTYTKNQNQKWSLHAETGVWALVFQRFSLEYSVSCEHDYLQIEEVSNRTTDDPIRPVRYCGELVPGPYVSVRPRLDVRFVSDDIWEMKGFLIQALHADDEVQLKEKMRPFIEMAEKSREKSRDNTSHETEEPISSDHPLFYLLIGCSVAALVVFGILLTYFVISIKKKETNLPSSGTESFYIRPTEVVPDNRKPNGIVGATSGGFACTVGKSGKRYSKDNKNNTARKMVAKVPNVHHNNLYVSGNLSNNG